MDLIKQTNRASHMFGGESEFRAMVENIKDWAQMYKSKMRPRVNNTMSMQIYDNSSTTTNDTGENLIVKLNILHIYKYIYIERESSQTSSAFEYSLIV